MTDRPAVDRIPIAHSVHYVALGLPEVPNQYGAGVLAPSEITLTYRTAPDSPLGRVHAYVAGCLWVDGAEIPLLKGGLYGQHYADGPRGWPEWLAGEARMHDPDTMPQPADRATVLADVERVIRNATGSCGYKASDGCDFCNGVDAALDQVRRMADEPQLAAGECPGWPECPAPGSCPGCTPPEAQQPASVDSELPSITADGEQVLIHLPEIHYLDTQVWAVDIGISTDALRQLRDAADAHLATIDGAPS